MHAPHRLCCGRALPPCSITFFATHAQVLLHALRDLLRQERQQARMLGDMSDQVEIPTR